MQGCDCCGGSPVLTPARGFRVSKIFATAILVILYLAILACSGGSSPSNGSAGSDSDPTPTPAPTSTPAPTPISVSADALQSEKELNEVAWENKYNNNIALITGTIDSITEAGSKYDVKLETGIFTVDVVCKIDKADESTVLSLQQGQTVSVLGRVTDDGILDIVVKDCSIASTGAAAQSAGQGQPATNTPVAIPAPTATAAATASPTAAITPTPSPTPASTLEPTSTPAPTATAAATTAPPTATPAPTVPPTATPTPTPIPPGTTLDNPIPAGEVLRGTDGTEIVVTGIIEDATSLVLETNPYNEPPEMGNQFYIVTVAARYVSGADSLNITSVDYRLIGDNRIVYNLAENYCGVIPDELGAELFPGGQSEGNVCFQVGSDDGNFVLIHEPLWNFGDERRFLRLDTQKLGSTTDLTEVSRATPEPSTMALPPGTALDNPVAVGDALQGTDGTEIVVTGIIEDATSLVLETNPFNESPKMGTQFYIVTVAVSYVSGADSLNITSADYSLIGDNRVVYTPFANPCGVIPDELRAELFPGGQAEGNVCFQVGSDDGNFVLIHKSILSFEGERRFLSLE